MDSPTVGLELGWANQHITSTAQLKECSGVGPLSGLHNGPPYVQTLCPAQAVDVSKNKRKYLNSRGSHDLRGIIQMHNLIYIYIWILYFDGFGVLFSFLMHA